MIKPIATVHVRPDLPKPIERLTDLANNLRWSWDAETIALFRRLDPDLWEHTYHNPVLMLGQLPQERLKEVSTDPAFIANYQRAIADFDAYMGAKDTWYRKTYTGKDTPIIAYFSMEYGLTEALKTYSGASAS